MLELQDVIAESPANTDREQLFYSESASDVSFSQLPGHQEA